LPSLTTKGGLDIFIGNGGFSNCMAKGICENGDNEDTTVFKYDFDFMRIEMMEQYEKLKKLYEIKKDPKFLEGAEECKRWVESVESDMRKEKDEMIIGKNYYCKWYTLIGNFMTEAMLHACRRLQEPEEFQSDVVHLGIDFGKKRDKTVVTLTDLHRNIRDWGVFQGSYYHDQPHQIAQWLEDRRIKDDPRRKLQYAMGHCDSTGEGDTAMEALQAQLPFPLYPVVFNSKSKDRLGKQALSAFQNQDSMYRASYPINHEYTEEFEQQCLALEKEYKTSAEFLSFHHPKGENNHDDFPDSFFLSLYEMEADRGIKEQSMKVSTSTEKSWQDKY